MSIGSTEYQQYYEKQVLDDIDKRSINGAYIYLAAWLLIGTATEFSKQHTLSFCIITGLFFLFSLSRLFVHFVISPSQKFSNALRIRLHYVNAILPSLTYSIIFSLTLYSTAFKDLFAYLLMAIIALISAGTLNFAPIKKLSIIYLMTLTLAPLTTALFLTKDRTNEGLMMLLYISYMVLLAIRVNREYSLLVEKQFSLTKLNQQDGLTGIFNRRFFDKSLDSAWKTTMRSQTSLVLVLIDIDFFKRVNDQYGHAVGDQVIKNVAAIIQSYCRRENDIAARIGGEEFAILTSNYSNEKFGLIAEKIRAEIATENMEIDGNSVAVTCSFGVAVAIPTLDKSISEFYKQADSCLYAAKNAGRNRVFCEKY